MIYNAVFKFKIDMFMDGKKRKYSSLSTLSGWIMEKERIYFIEIMKIIIFLLYMLRT